MQFPNYSKEMNMQNNQLRLYAGEVSMNVLVSSILTRKINLEHWELEFEMENVTVCSKRMRVSSAAHFLHFTQINSQNV